MAVIIVDTFDVDHPPARTGPPDPEPTADELLEAQAICERTLAAVETKAVRHVRTAEGARHFGEPVGAVIVADRVRPFAPQLAVDPAGAIDHLTSAIQGRYTLDDGEEVEVYANHVTEFGFDFDVFNKDEALIGSAQRGAYKRTNDVEHESMRMEEGYQGRGFARQFMDRSMQAYSDVGVERVNVQTQWTGGYAWARLGFRPKEEGGYTSTFAGRVLNLQDGKDTSQDAKDYIYERQLAGESLGDLDWILTIPGTSTVRYGDAESGYTDPTRVPAPVAALLNLAWHGSISPNEYLRRRGLERKMLAFDRHEDLVHELTLDNASQPLLDLYLASGYDTKGARHVRTREGAAFYDEPIGALIGPQSMLDHVEKVAEDAMVADKTITPRVITAVVNAGGKLEGLDKRMKKTAAIADRMMRNSQTAVRNDKEPDLALAAAGVPDALRYTAVFNDDDYVNGAIRLMKALDAQGFVGYPGGWGNAWNTSSYKGFNLRLEDEHGYAFELQIHTPSSYDAKRDSHLLYMKARSLPYGGERLAVVAQMQEIAAAVVTPNGAGGLLWRGRRAKRRSEPNIDKQFSFWQAGKKPYAYVGTKAARHVRTPEGAQHFGLPIGAVIKPDVMPSVIRPPGWKPPPPRGLAGTAAIDKLMGDLATVEHSNVTELPGRNGTLHVGDVVTRHGVEQGARVVSFHGDRALLTDGRMARATDLSLVAPPKNGPRTERAELEALEYVRLLDAHGDDTAGWVADYGEWWLPRDLPEGFERGEQKMCFANAWRLAMENEDLTYVEGFGVAEIGEGTYFPTHHAWVVDEDGYVIDPTWKDGVGYYGVPIKHEAIARIALASGVYGVFGNGRQTGSEADFDPEADISDVVGFEDPGVERPFEKSRWIKHSDGVSRWGENGAAGVLFRHEDDHGVVRYLLAKRGRHVDQGGTWGIPGGAIDDGETPLEAALREVDEEFGGAPAVYEVAHEYTAQPVPEWAYTTHVIDVQERFTATKLDWETERVGWFTAPEMARLNLHPGFAAGLAGLLAPPDANPPSPVMAETEIVGDWTPQQHARIVQTIEHLQARYSVPIKRVVMDPDRAAAGKSHDTIYLPTTWGDDLFMADREHELTGLTVQPTLEGTLVHEYGHMLDGIGNRDDADYRDRIDAYLSEEIDMPTLGKRLPRIQAGGTGDAASPYAMENRYEYVAEAFADHHFNGDSASPSGHFIGTLLEEKYGTSGGGDMSPEVWDTSYEKASAHYRYRGAHEVHVGDEVRIGGGVNAMRVSKVWDNGEVSVTKVSRTQGANTFTMPYERLRLVRRTAANPPAVAEGFMKASKPQAVSDADIQVLPDAPIDVKATYAKISPQAAHKIRKRKAAVKFYAKRRDGKNDDEAQALADAYERSALAEALVTPALADAPEVDQAAFEAPKPKAAKKPKDAPAVHPPSGRLDPYAPKETRGGDGPLPGGYRVGDVVRYMTHDGHYEVEIVDGETRESDNELWAAGSSGEYNTHKTRHETQLHARRTDGDHKPMWYPIDDLMPFDDAPVASVDPGYRVEPTLGAVDGAPLPIETLLPADSLEALRRLMKRKAIALDTKTDAYQGFYVADKHALDAAKLDGMRALGNTFGFTPLETDMAIARLNGWLDRWRTVGDIGPYRVEMHQAMQALRNGESADTINKRAMLLQKAWSNATWDERYGRDKRVTVGRFVQEHYAVQFEALDALTRPVPARAAGYDTEAVPEIPALHKPEDVTVNAWPLTSWSVTPAGVHSGFIGKYHPSVELTMDVGRDETWLHVWSESLFRTRGLKAPGEMIIDDRHELNLGSVKVTPHRATQGMPSNTFGGDPSGRWHERWLAAVEGHLRRHPDSSAEAVLAAGILAEQPTAGEALGLPVDAARSLPRTPGRERRHFRKDTGEMYDSGDANSWQRFDPPYEDRKEYDSRKVFVRDDANEAYVDKLAAIVHERGWTYNQVSRSLNAFSQFSTSVPEILAYTHERMPMNGWHIKTRDDWEKSRRSWIDELWPDYVANMQAAREALGLPPLDVDAYLADVWENGRGGHDAEGTVVWDPKLILKPAPAKVAQ